MTVIQMSYADRVRYASVVKELARRKMEGLALFVPLPHVEPFFKCRAPVRLVDGANQAGKTGHAGAEVAYALTGMDPFKKYPKRNGKALIVGLDGDHLANPMYTKLFIEGEFQIIRDEHTNKWRSVRPDPNDPKHLDPYDLAYKEKWKDAPPLIPDRLVKKTAWEDTAKRIPRITWMENGWSVLWRSSRGKPPQGVQMNLIWADEELFNTEQWIPEMVPRLSRRGGLLIWSATPQQGGAYLDEYRQKADAGDKNVKAFTLLIEDNPYISDEDRRIFKELLLTDEEVRTRFYGEYISRGRRVYAHFDAMDKHGCEPFPIPEDYSREIWLDPSRQRCGTLFAAIDPDEHHIYIYDGFALENSDANKWADEVKKRQGDTKFERAVIDPDMGSTASVGSSDEDTVARRYWDAAERRGVQIRRKGPKERKFAGFFPGKQRFAEREEAVLDALRIRTEPHVRGTCRLQVFRGCIPNLEKQFKWAQYDGRTPDKRIKDPMGPQDELDCCEFGLSSRPVYHEPEELDAADETPVTKAFKEFEKRGAGAVYTDTERQLARKFGYSIDEFVGQDSGRQSRSVIVA